MKTENLKILSLFLLILFIGALFVGLEFIEPSKEVDHQLPIQNLLKEKYDYPTDSLTLQNSRRHTSLILSEPLSLVTFNNITGTSQLHNQSFYGQNVKIGIIDNGIDFNIPAFENATYVEKDFTIPGFPSSETHGTPVAGTIIGHIDQFGMLNGSAPLATIYSARLGGDPFDASLQTNGSLIRQAFEWLISEKVNIISTSWFGSLLEWNDLIPILKDQNIILVGSVGNSGQIISDAPGNAPYGIGVGATNNLLNVSSFSGKGPNNNLYLKPDVVSLGEGIPSASVGFGFGIYSGTSFSAPYVAGGIASVLSALSYYNISYNPGLIKSALRLSATDLGYPIHHQGAGLVNFTKMLEILKSFSLDDANIPILIHSEDLYSSQYFNQSKSYHIERYNFLKEGIKTKLPFYVTSSDTISSIEITGNISLFEFSFLNDGYFNTELFINTTNTRNGYYEGNITLYISNSTYLTLFYYNEVNGSFTASVLKNVYYNSMLESGDFHPNYQFTPLMFQFQQARNIWLEIENVPINVSRFSRFDILWMASMFTKSVYSSIPIRNISEYESQILFNHSLDGGKIFYSVDSKQSLSNGNLFGLIKTPESSNFFKNYNIEILEKNNAMTYFVANDFNRIGKQSVLYSVGTSLSLNDIFHNSGLFYHHFYGQSLNPLLFGIEASIYPNSNTFGKTLFSGSSEWFINSAESGFIALFDVLNWLIDGFSIQLLDYSFSNSIMYLEIIHNYPREYLNSSLYSLLNNITSYPTSENTTVSSETSIEAYNFELDDDIYTFNFTINNVLRMTHTFTFDYQPPVLETFNTTKIVYENQTASDNSIIRFVFNVTEVITPLHLILFEVWLNDIKLPSRYYGVIFPNQFGVYLTLKDFDYKNPEHIITINATDTSGNFALFNHTFYFYIHEDKLNHSIPVITTDTIPISQEPMLPENKNNYLFIIIGITIPITAIAVSGYLGFKNKSKIHRFFKDLL
jgi:major intracellular serine protease